MVEMPVDAFTSHGIEPFILELQNRPASARPAQPKVMSSPAAWACARATASIPSEGSMPMTRSAPRRNKRRVDSAAAPAVQYR